MGLPISFVFCPSSAQDSVDSSFTKRVFQLHERISSPSPFHLARAPCSVTTSDGRFEKSRVSEQLSSGGITSLWSIRRKHHGTLQIGVSEVSIEVDSVCFLDHRRRDGGLQSRVSRGDGVIHATFYSHPQVSGTDPGVNEK